MIRGDLCCSLSAAPRRCMPRRYTQELGIKQVVIPLTASVHGATGLISSDVVYEYGRSDHLIAPFDLERFQENFAILIAQAHRDLASRGFTRKKCRDRAQPGYALPLSGPRADCSPCRPATGDIEQKDLEQLYDDFHELYEKSYGKGSGYREAGMEVMTFRLTARGRLKKPNVARLLA